MNALALDLAKAQSPPDRPLSRAAVKSAPGWPVSAVMDGLTALPTAPGDGREFCRKQLSEWGMGELTDALVVVVSELITNAARASTSAREDLGAGVVKMRLSTDHVELLIEVHDQAPGYPRLRDPGEYEDGEGGRGLVLVGAIADSWGWTAGDGGKTVWALLTMPCAAPGSA
jgi:anti-sigma regulatory factor (Ser/Thr protein kinase)